MQEINTPTNIDPNVWATYAAARVQADAARYAADVAAKAALNAAEIARDAALDAAWLQVKWGARVALLAAVAALVAGRWTYHAAIKAAEHQTKLENEKHQARIFAYAIRQQTVVWQFHRYVSLHVGRYNHLIENFNSNNVELKDVRLMFNSFGSHIIPKDWNEENWEHHALLGEEYVDLLSTVNIVSNELIRYVKYFDSLIKDQNINDTSKNDTIRHMLNTYKDLLNGLEGSSDRLKEAVKAKASR